MPTKDRFLTSLYLQYKNKTFLIDCGEGCQIAIQNAGLSFFSIDVICITHFHGDHILGLPGLLMTMSLHQRKDPVTIIGPRGIRQVVETICRFSAITFPISYQEVYDWTCVFQEDGLRITGISLDHNVVCFGYKFEVERRPKFDKEMALALEIPVQYWKKLQNGEMVKDGDTVWYPEDVTGEPRKGLSLVYATDTRPSQHLSDLIRDVDLFIGEAMYEDDTASARERKHSTAMETVWMANQANVHELWLTHFSPSFINPNEVESRVQEVLANTTMGYNGLNKDLIFTEE